jgi:hypothetical protein
VQKRKFRIVVDALLELDEKGQLSPQTKKALKGVSYFKVFKENNKYHKAIEFE